MAARPWEGMRWTALLVFALLGPIGLPAGGADRRQPEVRRRSVNEPLLTGGRLTLQASPGFEAPQLDMVEMGMPLQVLRAWVTSAGEQWLQVRTSSVGQIERPTRGWIRLLS